MYRATSRETVMNSFVMSMKKTAWTFQVWFKAAGSMQGKTARIWRVFGGERDHYREKSRFPERKGALTHWAPEFRCYGFDFPFGAENFIEFIIK